MDDFRLASPLTLIWESPPAREILVLSYTLDVGFFERTSLSAARATGGVVTIVGDAARAHADPRSITRAGVTYLDARARCRSGSAFHPKLVCIVSDTDATIAIGSGNATVSGWHHSAEIWTVLRARGGRGPAALADLGAWLTDLPRQVRFSEGVTEALGRVRRCIDRLDCSEAGPELVTSLSAPIVDFLPEGPVDDLLMYAPFIDPSGDALSALLDRLQPRSWELCLQADLGEYDGDVVGKLVEARDGRLAIVSADRYHHGKLLEWSVGGHRWALTGSPNLTRAALRHSMAEGGNCELALIQRIGASLRPATAVAESPATIAGHRYTPRASLPSACGVLLGVSTNGTVVRVTLGRALEEAGVLEVGSADEWTELAAIPAGVDEIEAHLEIAAGSTLRIRASDGSVSNAVSAADLARVRVPLAHTSARRHATEDDLYDDDGLLDRLRPDLLELRGAVEMTSRVADAASSAGDRVATARSPTFRTWEEWIALYEGHLGPRLTAYGLALPRLWGEGSRGWADERLGDTSVAEDEGTEEDQGGADRDRRRRDRSSKQRRRYARWCERIAPESLHLHAVARVAIARITLRLLGEGVWDRTRNGIPTLIDVTEALCIQERDHEEEKPALASVASVAISVIRGFAPPVIGHRDEIALRREQCEMKLTETLALRDPDRIDRVVDELRDLFGIKVDPSLVEGTAVAITAGGADAAVAEHLAERGWLVERDGLTWLVSDLQDDESAELVGLEVVGLHQNDQPVVVKVVSEHTTVVLVWTQRRLVVVDRNPRRTFGRLFQLGGILRPLDYALTEKRMPDDEISAWLGNRFSTDAKATLADAGISTEDVTEMLG